MAEYIKKLTMRNCCIDEDGRTDEPIIKKLNEVIDFINSIDVYPVRHGRWLDGRCTVCGWEEPDVCTWMGYDSEAWIETPYCPNCGAKMDGGRL